MIDISDNQKMRTNKEQRYLKNYEKYRKIWDKYENEVDAHFKEQDSKIKCKYKSVEKPVKNNVFSKELE